MLWAGLARAIEKGNNDFKYGKVATGGTAFIRVSGLLLYPLGQAHPRV